MTDDIHVRVANPSDVHDFMGLALGGAEENAFLNPDPARMLQEIWPALNLTGGICGIIKDANGKPEGGILLRLGKMWYSDEYTLEEKAIFIDPAFRNAKGGRARKLCEFGKRVSEELGLPLIIGVLSNHRTEGKVKMYQRIFGPPTGAFFLYGARTDTRIASAAE